MDLSFDIKNTEGDHIMVALSYYDIESIILFSSDPAILTLIFYDVTLVRCAGSGFVGYDVLNTVSDTLAKFLNENEDAVLCFYCDSDTDIRRSHKNISPQEFRSELFSKMFDRYVKSHKLPHFVNHRIRIEDEDNPKNTQFAHFICRLNHESAVKKMGKLLMSK